MGRRRYRKASAHPFIRVDSCNACLLIEKSVLIRSTLSRRWTNKSSALWFHRECTNAAATRVPFQVLFNTRDVACTLRILLQTYCQRIYYSRVQACQINRRSWRSRASMTSIHYRRIPLLNFAIKFEKMWYVQNSMEDGGLNLNSLKKLNIEISRLLFLFVGKCRR